MTKMIVLVLLYFIYLVGVEGTATITSLCCESANGLSSHLTVGREYTMYCSITGSNRPPIIIWAFSHDIFTLPVPENGAEASYNGFSARFVRSDVKSITASLTFTATASLDQIVIACQDTPEVSLVRDECRIQIGNSMSTSTISTTSTRDGSTVSTISTRGSILTASVGLGPTSALTTVPPDWSTTSKNISVKPFATSSVLPTSGERNNINTIVIIFVVAVIIVIVIIAVSIGLLSLCICKKSKFKSYGDSRDPSNTVSHVDNNVLYPVYDNIIKPSALTQSSDVQLSNNVAYSQIFDRAAHSTNITTSANAAYGQVSGIPNHSTNIATSANAAYGQVSGIPNHSTNIMTSANAAYGQV